jgi:hypothetical protein
MLAQKKGVVRKVSQYRTPFAFATTCQIDCNTPDGVLKSFAVELNIRRPFTGNSSNDWKTLE